MTTASASHSPGRVAVAIPCYNEAAAIGDLVERWKAALPSAEILVYDNNSTDATAILAQSAGATVVPVPKQGKGHAVQAIFSQLRDRPAVILTDGDGTYPPEDIQRLLAPILQDRADMVVAARKAVQDAGVSAMNPVRGLGNVLIQSAFRVLIGRGPGDLLSGYRVFGPAFLQTVKPRSSGFEIETELSGAAVAHALRVVEMPVPYYPRAEGTQSKLRAGRDGLRILWMIVKLSIRLRPARVLLFASSMLLGAVVALLLLRGRLF